MQQTRQQTLPILPRKRPKTMKNDTRQPFLAPFRADRATAVLGIVVRMTVDDLRQKAEAAARGMSVSVWSAFLAETLYRAKIATWVARFGRDLPSHHVVHGRRFGGCVSDPGASNGLIGQPRGAEIKSLNIASEPLLFGFISGAQGGRAMNPKSSGSGAILSEYEAIYAGGGGGCNTSFSNLLDER